MSLTSGDRPHDPEQMLQHLRLTAEIVAAQSARIAILEVESDTVLAERDAARTERDLTREKHDVAKAEIEKLRLLIRQLQRGRFGRRSEKLGPDQLQLGLEDLEQTIAAAEAAQEEVAARNCTSRRRGRTTTAAPVRRPRGAARGRDRAHPNHGPRAPRRCSGVPLRPGAEKEAIADGYSTIWSTA